MKKLLLLFLFFLSITFQINAQAFEWYKLFPTEIAAHEADNSVIVDADNNDLIYVGFFRDSIRIGNQLFVHNSAAWPNPTYSGYIVKYDPAGSVIWAKQINGTGISHLSATRDNTQNILITGIYKDSFSFDTTTFTSSGYSIFIAKLNSNGDLLWARNSSSPTSIPPIMRMQSRYIKSGIDQAGNIYLTGTYNDALRFGNTTINTNSNIGGVYLGSFFLKYDTNGNLLWLKNTPTVESGGTQMAVTKSGDFYYMSMGFIANGLLRKFNANGNLIWSRNIPTNGMSCNECISLGIDQTDNAYLAGYYTAPTTLGNYQLPLNFTSPFKPSYYIAKIDKAGTWKWVNEISTNFPPNNLGQINLAGKIYKEFSVVGRNLANLQLGDSLFTRPGTFVAKYDTLGSLLQTRQFITKNGYFHFIEALSADPAGNTYFVGSYQDNIRCGNFNLNTSGLTYTTRFLTKLQNYSNALTGTVFRDTNANGIKDTGEQPFTERILEITPGPIFVNTLSNGNYGTYLPAGNFNISIPNPPRHYTVAQASHTFAFSGLNQSLGGKDFALQPIPNSPDLKITLTPRTPARPGFNLFYTLTFTNVGTTILSDSLDLTFNAGLLTFQSASEAPVVQQTGKLKWTYQNLQPTEIRSINILMYLDSTAIIGNPLQTIAAIKPLVTYLFPQDNYDTLNQVITASFDPNDKLVNFDKLTQAEVSNGKALDYTIRFQNTGTDTAFTVIIRDEFSSKLNIPSFELLSASHPYSFRLLNNGLAEWRFDNILLPDSNRNEPASHGFIRYRIQPKNNLVLGDEIKSRAAIYFDYNAPVITNYAVTKVTNPLAVQKQKAALQEFKLYPNPAQNYVMVAAELKKPTAATVRLVNLLGQVISEVKLPTNSQVHYQLPLNNLPKGVYLVELETEAGRQVHRLIVQ